MFTFKKHIATGRFRSFENESHDIKLNRLVVGSIQELGGKSYDKFGDLAGKFRVSFMVKREKTLLDPAPFKWVRLKLHFNKADLAREFILANEAKLLKKFDLYQQER